MNWITLSRRQLLHRGLYASGALALWSCADEVPPVSPDAALPTDAGTGMDGGVDAGPTRNYFDLLEQLQSALRASPDHRAAKAQRLVTAGDLAGLHAFVRDEVALYPGEASAMGETRSVVRWGWRGTLRGGAGTMREKAELLAELYRQAGHTAEVMGGRWVERPDDARALLYRPLEAPFEPDLDDASYQALVREFTEGPLPTVNRIDVERSDSRALADQLHGIVVGSPDVGLTSLRPFDFRVSDFVPFVRLQADGQTSYANPIQPDAEFGTSYVRPSDEGTLLPPAVAPQVNLRLTAAMRASPDERIVLCESSYDPGELVGRQLIIGMGDGLPMEASAVTTYAQVRTFIPSMVMQALDLDTETAGTLSVIGEPITVAGERITLEEDGGVLIAGQRVAGPGGPATDTSSISTVEVVSVEAGSFPEIRVEAHVRDSNGLAVPGLAVSSFVIEEDGAPQSFMLRRNSDQPVISVLVDDSLSMPPEFRGEMGRAVSDALRSNLQQANPEAVVLHENTNSNLWKNLARASQANPTVVVYITDGDVSDDASDEIRGVLRAGPPVVLLKVRDAPRPALDEMASLSDGQVLLATEVQAAISAVTDYVQAREFPPYLLIYNAPLEGGATRNVGLSIADREVADDASYSAPAVPGLPNRMCGLYLEVEVNGQSYQRTLAGRLPRATLPVTEAHVAEVESALFGQYWVYFEGGMPSVSMWMDELLQTKARLHPFVDAVIDGDLDLMKSIVDSGLPILPSNPFAGIPPVSAEATSELTPFQDGLQIAIIGQRPAFEETHWVQTIDILPTARISVASEAGTAQERLRDTLRVSARTAIAERDLYETSTAGLLDGQPLMARPAGDVSPFDNTVDLELRTRWRALLESGPRAITIVPQSALPLSYWSIDPQTGALTGVLPNGSGGGAQEAQIRDTIKKVDEIITKYSLLINGAGAAGLLSPVGAISLSIVAEYGKTLVRLYAIVSVTITSLDASDLNDRIKKALLSLACNVVKAIILGAADSVPGARMQGNVLDVLDKLYGLVAEPSARALGAESAPDNPFGCADGF